MLGGLGYWEGMSIREGDNENRNEGRRWKVKGREDVKNREKG